MNESEEEATPYKSKKSMKVKGNLAKALSKKAQSRIAESEENCFIDFEPGVDDIPSDIEDSPDDIDIWIDYEKNRELRIRKSDKKKKIGNDPHRSQKPADK